MFLFGCSVSSSNGIGSSLGTRGMSAESDGVIKDIQWGCTAAVQNSAIFRVSSGIKGF